MKPSAAACSSLFSYNGVLEGELRSLSERGHDEWTEAYPIFLRKPDRNLYPSREFATSETTFRSISHF
jgi:hypothetical protein